MTEIHLTRSILALVLISLTVGSTENCSAQTIDNRQATLRERLITGLQVRRPSEFEFIDAVVDTVNRGELPERLVDRFFFWARNKAPKSRGGHRPIIYFQPGLSIQAAKLRIEIKADPEPAS